MAVVSIAACGDESDDARPTEPSAESPTVPEEQTISYFAAYEGTGSEPTMLRFVPGSDEGWPVAVLLHGYGMDGSGMTPLATRLAERGLIVYAPTYRHPLQGVSIDMMESGEWPGATLLGDLACAIRRALQDATDQGADPDRLTLVAYSQGATFGATVTILGDDRAFVSPTAGPCVATEGSAVPDAFVGWEGAYDWDEVASAEFPQLVEVAPDAIRLLGPLPHVEAGRGDELVPFHLRAGDQVYRSFSHADQLTTFGAALEDAGWPVTAEVLPGRFHTDFVEPPGIPEMDDLIVRIANDPTG